MSHRFWLVQRLEYWNHRGVLMFEYMGSAEYEFDTPSKALARLRKSELALVETDLSFEDQTRTIYVLCELDTLEEKLQAMKQWMTDGFHCKELSNFDAHFSERYVFDGKGDPDYYTTVVWWGFLEDFVWSLDKSWVEKFAQDFGLNTVELGKI